MGTIFPCCFTWKTVSKAKVPSRDSLEMSRSGDLGEEAEAVPLDPDLLLELEVLQLGGDERKVPLLGDHEDLSCKDQDAGSLFGRFKR